MTEFRAAPLRVAQVNCVIDEHDREPEELLQAWPTLPLIAEAAAGAGAEVHVLQSARTQRLHRAGGVTYRFFPERRGLKGSGPGLMPWRLAAEIRRLKPDLVHFHGFAARAHLWAACRAGAPVLVQDHAGNAHRHWAWLSRLSLKDAAACAFTAREQAQPRVAAGHLPGHLPLFEIIESSTRFTAGSQQQARAGTGVFGNPAVLWVGHFNSNKDPITVLRAVARVLPALPDLQLWCAFGSNGLVAEMNSLLAELPQLARHLHLLGPMPHSRIEALCRACDMFVLGSHRESCGFALLEALACGLVPVVSDIPSFRAITSHGTVGALVPPGDVDALAAAIAEQARSVTRRTRAAVCAHFEVNLSPAALGRRLVDAYRASIASGAHAGRR